jgi:isopenicillin-N N-acyltransferase like protein
MSESQRQTPMIRRIAVDLSGSVREAGRAYGEELAAEIGRQVEAYRGVYESLGMDAEGVAGRCEAEVLPATARVFPAYVDELRGRAEGAGVPFGQLLALHCIEEVWSWVGP